LEAARLVAGNAALPSAGDVIDVQRHTIYAKQLRSRDLTAETSSAGNPPDGLSRIDDLDALMGRTTTQKFCRRLMTMFAIRQLRQG
jgi:hypothetical protein